MAPGVDIWAAEEVLELKKANSEIKLICAVPGGTEITLEYAKKKTEK